MSELAFNVNGERFDVPDEAEFWRVRRFKPSGRGTPEVVFDTDGLPLVIPIDTDIHEFRRLVELQPGRYRLDPIDADQRGCEDATAAYVQLAEGGGPSSSGGSEVAGGSSSHHDDLIRDLVRVNAEMVKSITEKFATVMDSAATLIRAADGAGMPARTPVAPPVVDELEDDDDEDDEHRNAGGFDLGSFLAQMLPMFQMVMAQRNQSAAPAPTRNAAPEVDEDDDCEDGDEDVEDAGDGRTEAVPATVAPPGPQAMAHFAAIQSKLTPEEAQLAQAVASELPPREINAWIAQLSKC